MGIRFSCPNGHKLNVKEHLAGKRGVCPSCGAKFVIPSVSGSQDPGAEQSSSPVNTPQNTAAEASSASTSVVIAVADQTAPLTPSANGVEPITAPAESTLPLQVFRPDTEPTTKKASELSEPAPTVAKYVAHRQRNRRRQTTIAIFLILVVVVLAAVLIWILLNGTAASSNDLAAKARTRAAPLCRVGTAHQHSTFRAPLTTLNI
jgi:hypothetical protein